MGLFSKIFLCGTLVLGLTFSGAGYFLLHYSLESSLTREVDFALEQYQYDKFTVQAALLTYMDFQITLHTPGDSALGEEQTVSFWQVFPEGQVKVMEAASLKGQEVLGEAVSPESRMVSGESVFPEGQNAAEKEVSAEGQTSDGEQCYQNELGEKLFAILAEDISVPTAFLAEDGTPYYSEIEGLDSQFLDSLSGNTHVYRFLDTPEGSFILVGSMLDWDVPRAVVNMQSGSEWLNASSETRQVYFITQWDISKTIKQQNVMRQLFFRCYALGMTAGMALLGILSALLSGSLKRMAGAANRMAKGDYEERLSIRGRDEVGELAASFNQLAAAVEEKIQRLQMLAREKEDFVANFAHELKTPLTSIIGYADMLYQKELPREEVRNASWYIWNEGMRLEALSLKLMDLTVLERQEFTLEEMPADELLRDVAEGLGPIFLEKGTSISFQAEPAYIRVDYDLFKTLLINLIDNSMKAGGSRIELSGELKEEEYRIAVKDNGCGIRKEELSRITEAFYMVDKARSRKQHGAGLGLALAERIAQIHGGRLTFESEEGRGTVVSLQLKCEKGIAEDDEQ